MSPIVPLRGLKGTKNCFLIENALSCLNMLQAYIKIKVLNVPEMSPIVQLWCLKGTKNIFFSQRKCFILLFPFRYCYFQPPFIHILLIDVYLNNIYLIFLHW